MVATRRGARVSSPNRTDPEQSSAVQATPSTGRRTRSAKPAESITQDALVEETSSPPETEPGHSASPPIQTPTRRCTRASRLHSPQQPCTPVGSVHEADVSDVESCCSVVSDVESPVTRDRGRRNLPPSTKQEDDEISEVESCSSAVLTSKADQSSRRSTRRKKSSDTAHEVGDGKAVVVVETESCSSAVSQSQKVTRRSLRKSARIRSSAKEQTDDSELSDADSCASSVSGVEVSVSTIRRSTRSKRQTQAIPMYLDEASEGSQSPAPAGRRSRAARGKAAATAAVNESQSCDSEGFESGPSMTTRSRGKAQSTGARAVDSDSDLTDVHSQGSPCSSRGRGTPCSSRTGSGNSSRAAAMSRLSVKSLKVVLEKSVSSGAQQREETDEGLPAEANSQAGGVAEPVSEPAEEDSALNDSKVESTVIADPECTLLEEDKTIILEGKDEEEGVGTDLTPDDASAADSGVIEVGYGGSVTISMTADVEMCDSTSAVPSTNAPLSSASDSPCCTTEAVSEPLVTARDQREELSDENKDEGTSEMVLMQETQPPSEPLEPSEHPSCQSPQEIVCEQAITSEVAEENQEKGEDMEVIDVDNQPSLDDEPLGGDATEKTPGGGEEEMEVSTSSGDAQQVVESSETSVCFSEADKAQVESIQVTSSQEKRVTAEPESEQQPKDSAVNRGTGLISLLESSEDEDEDEYAEEEGSESSGEEEEEQMEEERVKPPKKHEAAGTSVEGLFMIDTRPGQEADQQYYKELSQEDEEDTKGQEEQDEEFVDEEGDDDDDEDAQLLFFSRNSQLKELSSRIDPGIRVKELGGLYINFDGSRSKSVSTTLKKLKEKKIQDEVMKKSVIGPEFEKKDAVPPYSESKQALKIKRREEREKSTGDGWFNMKAPELTQELKGDLHVLKMRGALDSKRFYKKNDRDGFPKYFQIGTVVDNPADFYHSRIPKKARKRTMVEELLADAEFRQTNKKKFQHIVAEKAAQGAGRRNKKKNRFHKKSI